MEKREKEIAESKAAFEEAKSQPSEAIAEVLRAASRPEPRGAFPLAGTVPVYFSEMVPAGEIRLVQVRGGEVEICKIVGTEVHADAGEDEFERRERGHGVRTVTIPSE